MPANVFDQGARYGAKKLDDRGFLAWAVAKVWAAYEFLRWEDTRMLPFPGEPDRTCDTVAAWRHRAGTEPPLATVLEFVSRPSSEILPRLSAYTHQVHEDIPYQAGDPRVPYQVIGVLVVLSGTGQPGSWAMKPRELEGIGGEFTPIVVPLADMVAAQELARIAAGEVAPCVLAWLALMQGGGDPGMIKQWKDLVAPMQDARLRADLCGLALVFAELAGCTAAWRQALKGWNMVESQVVREWQEEARKEARSEALTEGLRTATQEDLQQVLRARFQQQLAQEQQELLRKADLETLRRWFQWSLEAPSFDAFLADMS